jgi:hypothetical protein
MTKILANLNKENILTRLIQFYVFLLPWQAMYIFAEKYWGSNKWQYGTGIIYATEVLLWLILITFFITQNKTTSVNFWTTLKGKFLQRDSKLWATISIWFFVGWCGLTLLWSADRLVNYYLWFKLLEMTALLFVIINSKISQDKILWPFAISAGIQGLLAGWQFSSQTINPSTLLGIAQHFAGSYGGIVIETASGRWLRAYGTFNHPNILGGFCSLGLLATLILMRKQKNLFWLGCLTLLSSFGLFLSFSRSAWLATTCAVAYLFFGSYNKFLNKKFGLTILPSVAIIILLCFSFYPLLFTRVDYNNRLEKQSVNQRISQAEQAIDLISANPVLGTGFNNYTLRLKQLFPQAPAFDLQPVHNIYLLLAGETGLVGLILFLLAIFAILWLAIKRGGWINLSLPLTLLIIGLFDHYLLTQYIGLAMLWLSLTFALTIAKIDKNSEL